MLEVIPGSPRSATRPGNDDLKDKSLDTHLTGTPPMALVLTEEQSMLRDSARGLISDKAPVSHLRSLRDARTPRDFPASSGRRLPRWAFPACWCRRILAAAGSAAVEAGVVMEEIGRTLMPSPFLSTAVLGGLRADARRQRCAKGSASAEDFGRLAARRARGRRRRKTSSAADQIAGGAFRQRF